MDKITNDEYCVQICNGGCCKTKTHKCINLADDGSCKIYDTFRNGICNFNHMRRPLSIQEAFSKNMLYPEIKEKCIYMHPELAQQCYKVDGKWYLRDINNDNEKNN